MKKFIILILTCDCLFADGEDFESQTSIYGDLTPLGVSITDFYLKEHSLTKIKSVFADDHFDRQLPLLKKMIAKEEESGFFGYHGCSQRYRIFQDILRAVFEEVLDLEIPYDFQFLRIPGDKMFALKNNKYSFYALFDRKEASASTKMKIVDALFLKPFNENFSRKITIADLTSQEKMELWLIAFDFVETLDSLAKEDYCDYDFEEEKTAIALDLPALPQSALMPSRRILSIQKKLHKLMHLIEAQENAENNPLRNLTPPSLAINKIHKIFMRVLSKKQKSVVASQVKNQIAMNFKFSVLLAKIFNLTYSDPADFFLWDFFFPYNDTKSEQQSRILCLNIPLFGNYQRLDESSVFIFLNDHSIEDGDSRVMKLLSDYFAQIGLDKNLPEKLREIAITELTNAGNRQGCIMQFFDLSESNGKTPYQGVDMAAYVSHTFGIPLKQLEPSQLLLNEHPIRRKNLDLQLRLIPCNHTTLNPYSFLRVVRYDTLDPQISKRIIVKMRGELKTGIENTQKLQAYKAAIEKSWNAN